MALTPFVLTLGVLVYVNITNLRLSFGFQNKYSLHKPHFMSENRNSRCVYSFLGGRGGAGADCTELFRRVDKTREEWLSEIST